MKIHTLRATAIAAALLAASISARAADPVTMESGSAPAMAEPSLKIAEAAAKKALDDLGIEFWGYARGGAYGSTKGQPKGKYAVGDLGYYRLGNEGDNYAEFGIAKKWSISGAKMGVYWMPFVYDGLAGATDRGTKQIYVDMTGLSFAPDISLWAGQRYHRIQDVHIIDNWLMEDGDNYGAGVDGIKVGFGKLNVAAYNDGSTGNGNATIANGKRVNFQWREMPVNPNGALTVTGGYVRGAYGDNKKDGFALGLLHNQKDVGVKGLTNSLFVQGSNGHASLKGEFNAGPEARQFRIVDSINWQTGPFGGQAVVGYVTNKPVATAIETKDATIGGRVTYGIAPNVKLEGEAAIGTRKVTNQDSQRLTKATVAIGFSPTTDFWSRPEFRVYVTQANWNDGARAANPAFGGNDVSRKAATVFGAQMEAWW